MKRPCSAKHAGAALPAALALVLAGACGGGQSPATRYYTLAQQPSAEPRAATAQAPALAIEPLRIDDAYSDQRLVYRTSPYQLDYYNYHRWASPPDQEVTEFLARGYQQTGLFRSVIRDGGEGAPVVLRGRILALEEIDENTTEWLGHLALELRLEDADTGKVLWDRRIDERVPMKQQSPEGLARALSEALARVVASTAPQIAEAAARASQKPSQDAPSRE